MADRDKELDEIQRDLGAEPPPAAPRLPGTPFIARPDSFDVRPGTLCWNDGSRVCGPDCVSFNVELLNEHGELENDTPNKCLILGYLGQQASGALQLVHITKKNQSEAVRQATAPMPPVPSPTGRTRP